MSFWFALVFALLLNSKLFLSTIYSRACVVETVPFCSSRSVCCFFSHSGLSQFKILRRKYTSVSAADVGVLAKKTCWWTFVVIVEGRIVFTGFCWIWIESVAVFSLYCFCCFTLVWLERSSETWRKFFFRSLTIWDHSGCCRPGRLVLLGRRSSIDFRRDACDASHGNSLRLFVHRLERVGQRNLTACCCCWRWRRWRSQMLVFEVSVNIPFPEAPSSTSAPSFWALVMSVHTVASYRSDCKPKDLWQLLRVSTYERLHKLVSLVHASQAKLLHKRLCPEKLFAVILSPCQCLGFWLLWTPVVVSVRAIPKWRCISCVLYWRELWRFDACVISVAI